MPSRLIIIGVAHFDAPVVAAADSNSVAVELVLAIDTSASVDRREFQLQVDGLAAAFRDPEVIEAIENLRPQGAAIAVMQWAGPGETWSVVPFTTVRSERDAKAFGFRTSLIPRWIRAGSTSISTGINDSIALIEDNEFDGGRKVIDVSGDGRNNSGPDLDSARRRAEALDITINALPITTDDPRLANYYRDHVIVGADCFIEPAYDFSDYARAIKEKLIRELRPLGS